MIFRCSTVSADLLSEVGSPVFSRGRLRLLCSVSLVGLVAAAVLYPANFALAQVAGGAAGQGGAGGGSGGGIGGVPSSSVIGTAGGGPVNPGGANGGGGGGAGPASLSGAGGASGSWGQTAAGGTGNGGAGQSQSTEGGGGGGAGGWHGYVAPIYFGVNVAGSNGGAGGSVGGGLFGDGGGGGGGGYGMVVTQIAIFDANLSLTGGNGGAGGSVSHTGAGEGGGGGGGGHALYLEQGSPSASVMTVFTGGDGGAGGSTSAEYGNGGSGGEGGSGIVANMTSSIVISGSILGGNGGNGGNATSGLGGLGGAGGAGIIYAAGGALTVFGSVTGGNGGSGGVGGSFGTNDNGAGGVGVRGSNLSVAISGTGTIAGGFAGGDPTAQAHAVEFTGGTNVISFGRAVSGLTGNIHVGTGATAQLNAFNGGTTVSNVISGAGGIIQDSAHTLTLSGLNTFTGETSIRSGELVLSASGSLAGTVNNAAAFTNAGTVAGATTSSAGTVFNNGTMAGVTVSGGMFTGTGTATSMNVTGGTLAPGSGTAGTSMTLGSLTMTAASTFQVNVDATSSSSVNVTGAAALGGATVQANFAPGTYVERQYTILTSAGRTGEFGTLNTTGAPSNFSTSLAYDASNVYLNLSLSYKPPSGSLNQNQQAVAGVLENFFNRTGSIPVEFGSLSQHDLTQASGELGAGSQQGTFMIAFMFMNGMLDNGLSGSAGPSPSQPLAYAGTRSPTDAFASMDRARADQSVQSRWTSWASTFGGTQRSFANSTIGSGDIRSRAVGGMAGASYHFSDNTVAGFALGGGGTSFTLDGRGSGRSDMFQAGAFGRHQSGASYISAALAYTWQDIHTQRSFGGQNLTARYSSNAFSARLEAGHRFAASPLAMGFSPYAAVETVSIWLPDYSESSGGLFALNYSGRSVTSPRSELGVRADKAVEVDEGTFTFRGRAAWAHNFLTERAIGATFQALPGTSFIVNGSPQAREAALVSASAEFAWRNNWSLAATFEGEFSNAGAGYGGHGVLRYRW